MNSTSRRTFIAVGGAGVAAAAVTPAILGSTADAAAAGSVVAYIKDASTGQVAVMQGEREVVVTDKALVASLAKYLRS